MASFNPVGPAAPQSVSVKAKASFVTTSYTIVAADTEESFVIPLGTTAFRIRASNMDRLIFSDSVGGTALDTTSFSLYPGESWEEELLIGASALTVYVQARKAGTVIQLLLWS